MRSIFRENVGKSTHEINVLFNLKTAYMSHHSGNVNVILIDWGKLAAAPFYDQAAGKAKI
jgi:hypothetical protein